MSTFSKQCNYYKRIATKNLNGLPQKYIAKHLKNTQRIW